MNEAKLDLLLELIQWLSLAVVDNISSQEERKIFIKRYNEIIKEISNLEKGCNNDL